MSQQPDTAALPDELDALIDAARPSGLRGELEAERQAFYAARSFDAFSARHDEHVRRSTPWAAFRRWVQASAETFAASPLRVGAALGGLACAATIAVVALSPPTKTAEQSMASLPIDPNTDVVRIKGLVPGPAETAESPLGVPTGVGGEVGLTVFARTDAGVTQLAGGASLVEGDRLRLVYDSEGWTHSLVVTIDERGQVGPLYTEDNVRSMAVAPGRGVALPGSVVLDGYVGEEVVAAVFSMEPIDVSEIRRAMAGYRGGDGGLRDFASGALSEEISQPHRVALFWYQKVDPDGQ